MDETAAPSVAPASGAGLPLFYKDPHVLEPGRHRSAGLVIPEGMGFAAATNSVPIAADEFFAAQAHYPIVFTSGDAPSAVAVVGVFGDRNAFLDAAGRWQAGAYVPAYVRRYPFIFVRGDSTPERWMLAVDEASSAYRAAEGRPFFE